MVGSSPILIGCTHYTVYVPHMWIYLGYIQILGDVTVVQACALCLCCIDIYIYKYIYIYVMMWIYEHVVLLKYYFGHFAMSRAAQQSWIWPRGPSVNQQLGRWKGLARMMFAILYFMIPSQPMVHCWFGARCFGFLGSPYESDCYLRAPDSNPKPPGPKPTINH